MRSYFIVFALVCSTTSALSGCAGVDWIYSDNDISTEEVREAVNQGKTEKLLGKPEKVVQLEDRRIEAYEILEGREYFGSLIPPVLIPLDSDYSYITITYDHEGSLLDVQTWPDDTVEDAIDSYLRYEAISVLCNTPFPEAIELSDYTMLERYLECTKGYFGRRISKQSRAMWTCLAAHRSHPPAFQEMAFYYEKEFETTGLTDHLLQAWMWYSLALDNGVRSDLEREEVSSLMTTAQYAEARQMFRGWQPNPAECQQFQAAKLSQAHKINIPL